MATETKSPGLHFELAAVVLELLGRDVALRLQAGVDDDEVGVDADHFGGDDFARAHFLARQALLEQRGEVLDDVGGLVGVAVAVVITGNRNSSKTHRIRRGQLMTVPSGGCTCRALTTGQRAICCESPADTSPAPAGRPDRHSGRWYRARGHHRIARAAPRSRLASRASRSLMSCKRVGSLASIPFSINCLWRRRARSSGLAVRNTLSAGLREHHRAHVAAVRDQPRGRRKARWRSSSAARTGCRPATREAAADTSSVRSCSVTSSPASSTVSSRKLQSSSRATRAKRLGSSKVDPGAQGLQGHQPVERPAVQELEAEGFGDPPGHRPLAGGRRPVDGDDRGSANVGPGSGVTVRRHASEARRSAHPPRPAVAT